METKHLVGLLARTPLADGLDPEDVRRLAEAGELRDVGRGALLIEEGVRGSDLLVVLAGEVEVLKGHEDDQADPVRLVTLEKGTVLGEIGLVLGEPASATVRTTRPSTLFFLGRERFLELVGRGGAAASAITLSLAKILAARLQRMNEEAVELCERYEEVLAEAGEAKRSVRGAELARFKDQLLAEWNF